MSKKRISEERRFHGFVKAREKENGFSFFSPPSLCRRIVKPVLEHCRRRRRDPPQLNIYYFTTLSLSLCVCVYAHVLRIIYTCRSSSLSSPRTPSMPKLLLTRRRVGVRSASVCVHALYGRRQPPSPTVYAVHVHNIYAVVVIYYFPVTNNNNNYYYIHYRRRRHRRRRGSISGARSPNYIRSQNHYEQTPAIILFYRKTFEYSPGSVYVDRPIVASYW